MFANGLAMSRGAVRLLRNRTTVCAALSILFVLTACSPMNPNRIHIRIQNASPVDITDFWLGAGSGAGGPGSRAYGAIPSGATTPYRSLKAEFGYYSNYNFITADGQRFVGSTIPVDQIGRVTLDPGYYSFVIDTSGRSDLLQIVADVPERPGE